MNVIRWNRWVIAPIALLAFAGNSLLARAALSDPMNGPGAFAAVRLVAGAVALIALSTARGYAFVPRRRNAPTVVALFAYAMGFALAYVSIGAATGALILFTAVQVTIVGIGVHRGDRVTLIQGTGLVTALSGVGWLLLPGLSAPSPSAAALMACAGIAWGIYSTANSDDDAPVERTTRNFTGAAALGFIVLIALPLRLNSAGWFLALTSGAITSALGYALWYALLPKITRVAAASLQLLVPPITALGAAVLLGEPISSRIVAASVLTIGGIALVMRA